MSKRSDLARIEIVFSILNDLENILTRHKDIYKSLDDVESKYAILMCLQQIGENLGRLENRNWKIQLEAKEAHLLRNSIVHDYMGIKLSLIQNILEVDIPNLKIKLTEILKSLNLY